MGRKREGKKRKRKEDGKGGEGKGEREGKAEEGEEVGKGREKEKGREWEDPMDLIPPRKNFLATPLLSPRSCDCCRNLNRHI